MMKFHHNKQLPKTPGKTPDFNIEYSKNYAKFMILRRSSTYICFNDNCQRNCQVYLNYKFQSQWSS